MEQLSEKRDVLQKECNEMDVEVAALARNLKQATLEAEFADEMKQKEVAEVVEEFAAYRKEQDAQQMVAEDYRSTIHRAETRRQELQEQCDQLEE